MAFSRRGARRRWRQASRCRDPAFFGALWLERSGTERCGLRNIEWPGMIGIAPGQALSALFRQESGVPCSRSEGGGREQDPGPRLQKFHSEGARR